MVADFFVCSKQASSPKGSVPYIYRRVWKGFEMPWFMGEGMGCLFYCRCWSRTPITILVDIYEDIKLVTGWWFQPRWKILTDWIIIPTIGENKFHVPNHQPVFYGFQSNKHHWGETHIPSNPCQFRPSSSTARPFHAAGCLKVQPATGGTLG